MEPIKPPNIDIPRHVRVDIMDDEGHIVDSFNVPLQRQKNGRYVYQRRDDARWLAWYDSEARCSLTISFNPPAQQTSYGRSGS